MTVINDRAADQLFRELWGELHLRKGRIRGDEARFRFFSLSFSIGGGGLAEVWRG